MYLLVTREIVLCFPVSSNLESRPSMIIPIIALSADCLRSMTFSLPKLHSYVFLFINTGGKQDTGMHGKMQDMFNRFKFFKVVSFK